MCHLIGACLLSTENLRHLGQSVGGGALAHSVGIGTLQIILHDSTPLHLKNTLYGPKLVPTLMSVSQITKLNCPVLIGEDIEAGAYMYKKYDRKLMLCAVLTADYIYVRDVRTPSRVAMFASPAETVELWHRRKGHRNYRQA